MDYEWIELFLDHHLIALTKVLRRYKNQDGVFTLDLSVLVTQRAPLKIAKKIISKGIINPAVLYCPPLNLRYSIRLAIILQH